MKIGVLLPIAALLALPACAAPPEADTDTAFKMVVVDEADVTRDEPPPHGQLGMSTAYRISDVAPERTMEFRKRALHPGSAIGLHPIKHDEVYYVVSGTGVVTSDGEDAELGPGMAAYLYDGSVVGIKQTGAEPLVLIISYPLPGHPRLKGDEE